MRTTQEPNTDCLVWTAGRNACGYGTLVRNGRSQLAHRVIYAETIGPIPPGMTIDHLCRNRACVNTEHMEVVTPLENTLRSRTLGDTCLRGHPWTPENTEARVDGRRRCLECRRARERERWPAKRERQKRRALQKTVA